MLKRHERGVGTAGPKNGARDVATGTRDPAAARAVANVKLEAAEHHGELRLQAADDRPTAL
eukprot:4465344-Alexandrium_andersonii.AAC.1